ncbi:hypothetical protein IKS86_08320 [bacterium]|nr:hypothetical protein [bacterium]
MKKITLFLLIFSIFPVFAETVEKPSENTGNTGTQPVETLPEASPQTGKPEITWKFYSKNKAHVFVDQDISGGAAKDTYSVLQTEDLGEITYKNYTFGIRKTLLFFAGKNDDYDYVKNFDYVYSDEHFNHCWEQYLDRIYAKGKWKNFQFTAGDFYESMNRGMAFSMKNDQVYGDNSIRGGNIAGNYNGFFIKAFGGRANPQLRDSATFKRMNEADDWLAGMETGYKWKIAEAAVQYGYGNYGKYDLVTPVSTATVKTGVSAEKEFHFIGSYVALRNPFPGFSFYAGAVYVPYGYENTTENKQIKENDPKIDKEKNDLQNAAAFYSSLLYYFDFGEKKSRLTFKLEGKMYNKFFLNYNRMEDSDYQKRRYFNPPTLLPKELQIDNEFDTWAVGGRISFNENYSGIKFHADLVKGDSLGNKSALPQSRTNLILNYQAEDFWYSALSGEKEWKHVSLSAGAGWHKVDGNSNRKNSRNWIISFIHIGGFVSDWSMKLTNDYYHKDYWLDDVHEMDNVHELKTVAEVSWKYKRTHEFFAAVKNTTWIEKKYKTVQYDDEEEEGVFKDVVGGGNSFHYSPTFYTGGSIGYKYKFLRTYVFGGLEKGGFTCDGGTCRYLPDFKGVKVEIEINL